MANNETNSTPLINLNLARIAEKKPSPAKKKIDTDQRALKTAIKHLVFGKKKEKKRK